MKRIVVTVVLLTVAMGLFAAGSTEEGADGLEALGFRESGYPIIQGEYTLSVGFWTPPQLTRTVNEMEFIVELAELTGVDVEWDSMGRDNDAAQKMTLQVAAGDMNDIYLKAIWNPANAAPGWAEEGLLLYIDEYLDLMPNLSRLYEDYPDVRSATTLPNGRLLSTPHLINDVDSSYSGVNIINQSWLESLDLDYPRSADELLDVLRAFKTQDPNGNGDVDEIPLSGLWRFGLNPTAESGSLAHFSGYFGISGGSPLANIVDDEPVSFWRMPGARAFVEWLETLYQEGLVPEDVFTVNDAEQNSRVRSGSVGTMNGWSIQNVFGAAGLEDYVHLYPLASDYGTPRYARLATDRYASDGYVISASIEFPEVGARWLDTLYTKDPGLKLSNGPIGWADAEETQWFQLPIPAGDTAANYRNNTATPQNSFSDFYLRGVSQVIEPGSIAERRAFLRGIVERGLYPDAVGPGGSFYRITNEEQDRIAPRVADLNEYIDATVAQMVFDGTVDERWDEFQAELDVLGLSEVYEVYGDIYRRAVDAGFEPEFAGTGVYRGILENSGPVFDPTQFLPASMR